MFKLFTYKVYKIEEKEKNFIIKLKLDKFVYLKNRLVISYN